MILEYYLDYPSWAERMPRHYVTFGRMVVPPHDTPQAWLDWADRAGVETGPR